MNMGVELLEQLKSQDKYRKLFHSWTDREFNLGICEKEEDLKRDLEKLSQQIGVKDDLFIGSFDYRDFSLAFFTDNIYHVSGLPAEYFKKYGLEATMSMFHEEDRQEVIKFQKLNIEVYDQLSLSEKKTFGSSYTYRWVHRLTNEHIWMQTTIRPYLVDSKGNIILDLHVATILKAPPSPAKFQWSYFYTADNGAFIKQEKQFESDFRKVLSKREFQVAELMGRGMPSNQISQELGISINTVVTHRKNIMKKLKVKSSVEIVKMMLHQS